MQSGTDSLRKLFWTPSRPLTRGDCLGVPGCVLLSDLRTRADVVRVLTAGGEQFSPLSTVTEILMRRPQPGSAVQAWVSPVIASVVARPSLLDASGASWVAS